MILWILNRRLPPKNFLQPPTYGKQKRQLSTLGFKVSVVINRHNVELNKYFYIDENGRSAECLKNGKFPNKFIPNKTGHIGFKDRQGLANTVCIRTFL